MTVTLEHLPTLRTLTRFSVRPGVDITHMLLQVARLTEGPLALRTPVRPVSKVDSRVTIQIPGAAESLVAEKTPIRSLSAVGSTVPSETMRLGEMFATDGTVERLLVQVTTPVCRKIVSTLQAPATLWALVFSPMNIHM